MVADQATKAVVRSTVGLGDAVHAVGPFSIHHVRNSGILGGHLQGAAVPVGVVTSLALAGFLVYLVRQRGARPIVQVALGLFLGGAIGNLADRLRLGYVTDFIDRGGGGAFNLADVAIFLGLAVILIATVLAPSAVRDVPAGSADR